MSFELDVQVFDEARIDAETGQVQAVQRWEQPDQAIIKISVENVNTHQPEWYVFIMIFQTFITMILEANHS